jgi:hypothetical protein
MKEDRRGFFKFLGKVALMPVLFGATIRGERKDAKPTEEEKYMEHVVLVEDIISDPYGAPLIKHLGKYEGFGYVITCRKLIDHLTEMLKNYNDSQSIANLSVPAQRVLGTPVVMAYNSAIIYLSRIDNVVSILWVKWIVDSVMRDMPDWMKFQVVEGKGFSMLFEKWSPVLGANNCSLDPFSMEELYAKKEAARKVGKRRSRAKSRG